MRALLILLCLHTVICHENTLNKTQIQCTKPNEYFDCGSFCDTTCATLGEVCPVQSYVCVERCYCISGYARDSNDDCIPIEDCPQIEPCGGDPNAISVPCGDPCPETCDNKDDTVMRPCPEICIIDGCRCKYGFVQDKSGKCILPENCPQTSCNGDPNAISLPCGDPCPVTCKNKNILTPRPCPAICLIDGCACKKGYVLNDKGLCILPEYCEEECEENEMWKDCGTCDPSCENLNPICMLAKICRKGCYCKPGYVRQDGKCISKDECSKPVCDDPNAISVPCGDPCPRTCLNRDNPFPRPCPEICLINGCKCKLGYVIGQDGMCILAEDCFPGVCIGINEEYNTCVPHCNEPSCWGLFSGLKEKCPGPEINDRCTAGCLCKPGYVRNDDNVCVLPEKCCPRNAEIVRCPNVCPGGTCRKREFLPCKIKCPYKGCQCKKGYVKWSSKNKKCVPIHKCPKQDPW